MNTQHPETTQREATQEEATQEEAEDTTEQYNKQARDLVKQNGTAQQVLVTSRINEPMSKSESIESIAA